MEATDERVRNRTMLLAALDQVELPAQVRGLDQYDDFEDTILYASSPTRAVVVTVSEAVGWTHLDVFVEEANLHLDLPVLNISVPNSLLGRVDDVIRLVRDWFAQD